MIQIPYQQIGEGVAFILIIVAFIEAENKGRIIIAALFLSTLILPALFHLPSPKLIGTVARLLIGTGCYIYHKYITTIT